MRQRVIKALAAFLLIIAGIGVTAAVADAAGVIDVAGSDAAGWE
jgi:hypothetical protein